MNDPYLDTAQHTVSVQLDDTASSILILQLLAYLTMANGNAKLGKALLKEVERIERNLNVSS